MFEREWVTVLLELYHKAANEEVHAVSELFSKLFKAFSSFKHMSFLRFKEIFNFSYMLKTQ